MYKFWLLSILLITSLIACRQDKAIKKAVISMDISLTIERFDNAFSETPIKNFNSLKQAFPYMFPDSYTDSLFVLDKQDTIQQLLYKEVKKHFTNFNPIRTDLELFYKHLKHFFPEINTPKIITTTSNVDYKNRVIVTDSLALIALDAYLGKEHEFYVNIQYYIKQNFEKDLISSDLADAYAKILIQQNRKQFVDELIYYGKILYFKDIMLPLKTDSEKIGYSFEQIDWAKVNEGNIWRYFIDNELLYSTDKKLLTRFTEIAPFSKFYLSEIDTSSPGRIGQYIGWQIVRSYMKNNTFSLKKLLTTDADIIFRNSKYKPPK